MPSFTPLTIALLLASLAGCLTSCVSPLGSEEEERVAGRLVTVAEGLELPLPHDYPAAIALLESHDFKIQQYTSNSAVATKRYNPPIQAVIHTPTSSKVTAHVHQINLAAYSINGIPTVVFEQSFNQSY